MPITYNIEVDETPADLTTLGTKEMDLVVAKDVGMQGSEPRQVIFHSSNSPGGKLSIRNNISWTTNYAVNYTDTLPASGGTITGGGDWQSFSPGDTVVLNQFGVWESHPASTSPSKMTTVRNHFQAVHVIIGVESDGAYEPIITLDLPMDNTLQYQAAEIIYLWWERNTQTSTHIEKLKSTPKKYTLHDGGLVYFYFNTANAEWSDQISGPFPH